VYLLDTNIVVYFLKADAAVIKSFEAHSADPKAISVVTYGELIYGAENSARTIENLARVRRLVEVLPVFDVSMAIMDSFGALKAEGEKRGKKVDDFDWIIAATALVRGLTVVTNNEKHFRGIPGLKVENWARK
jgi:tRNA(fMet)-specific endonuclease VapC